LRRGASSSLVRRFQSFSRSAGSKVGAEAEAILAHVVEVLGDEPYKTDYWAPTPGNAGHAAAILLGWAKLYPDATFEVH